MSKWSMMAYGSTGDGWCARKINDDSIATDGVIFYGDNAQERCESFVKDANENPSGSLCMFPVPATGKWEKEFEWTGEVRQVKFGDWYINGAGYASFAQYNSVVFNPSYYILKKKRPKWEVGKAYWDKNKLCFYIRNINGVWLRDNGTQSPIIDVNMSGDIVTDQEVWNLVRSVTSSEYKSISFMINALKDTWMSLANYTLKE